MRFFSPTRRFGLTAVAMASLVMLAACGGTDSADAGGGGGSPVVPATTIAGTVAVGAPITNGRLRVLDANGNVVVSDLAIAADGTYADVTLTGPAPYRIEACGYAGPNYLCVYSVTSAAGTANVTPLTSAMVLLASGQSPDTLMSGSNPALTTDSIASAQDQLRTSLSSVLASAGITGTLDFVSSPLDAGSRTGYDGVLDAIGVSTGSDAGTAFVQITPRIGEGNVYMTQGDTSGTVTTTASASSLQLGGLETLFNNMTASLASASACSETSTGILRSLAPNAHMQLGDGNDVARGATAVAQGLCSFFAQGDNGTPMWGSRLMSPTLGRCDTSATPTCRVSFVLQDTDGNVKPVGDGMAVTQVDGQWKFLGDLLPISLHAAAKAQRTRRIDSTEPVFDYDRALAFDVGAVSGLMCAQISQRDSSGAATTIAYFKRYGENVQRLSLWTVDGWGNGASTDRLVGQLRGPDDTWVALPQGTDGDAVVRNFYRGGRTVTFSFFSDGDCSVPMAIEGQTSYDVDVNGVPPVWSAMESLPWPELDADSVSALRSLAIDGGASGSFHAAWSFAHGPLGLDGATVCASRADCGDGGNGRLGDRGLSPSARDATISLSNRGSVVNANDAKTLALYGRTGDGVDLQSNYSSCPGAAAGESCH
ncbi:hypothetical protein LRH25_16950 [Ideonella azotifigens]|uniref:Carboxypeptidase regulatory-like domain-containing protein n=2 Tax=Ideonella azotifigens TaxID=513160 RepID=A0ABN1JIY1_9BURK|nr:hypothetical protein [Ideonella azotifigens]MCD2342030.1 hypothetical protein [Ideonella azotifigens]